MKDMCLEISLNDSMKHEKKKLAVQQQKKHNKRHDEG